MYFREWESLVGGGFFANSKLSLRKRKVLWESKIPVFALKNILDKSQNLHRLTSLLCKAKPIFVPTFPQPTPTSHFHRNKDNVHFHFSLTACGGKHALQLHFFAKPDSAFVVQLPFRTGSKPKNWFWGWKLQILSKTFLYRALNRLRESRGPRPSVCFLVLLAEAKRT